MSKIRLKENGDERRSGVTTRPPEASKPPKIPLKMALLREKGFSKYFMGTVSGDR